MIQAAWSRASALDSADAGRRRHGVRSDAAGMDCLMIICLTAGRLAARRVKGPMGYCRPAQEQVSTVVAGLADELAGAASETEVWSIASAFARRNLGARHAALLVRHRPIPGDSHHYSARFRTAGMQQVAPFRCGCELAGLGLVAAPPAGEGGALHGLFDAIPDAAEGGLAYAEVDGRHVLLLVYRGACPVLSRRSWVLLDCLRQRVADALGRLDCGMLGAAGAAHALRPLA